MPTNKITGKPVSQTTGLYYYFHRWYDPSTGRFISPDPKQGELNNPQILNLYIYVIDDPTTLRDLSGSTGGTHSHGAGNNKHKHSRLQSL
ncbi:hypothetical protein E6H32_00145 [Candidatus Bathyarchaeota archaeon]|nr:MAG: hypothetical protein E6H32_00145 [Candidatus Bathyarchaeota archaeon]